MPLKIAVPIMPHYVNIAWGGFICGSAFTALCLFTFTASNKSSIKRKKQCAVNSAGKGKPQKGWRGEYQAAEGTFWG
jgi:hypothetical protein